MSFRISVLGSGTIIPTKDRNATSLLVEVAGENVLFDCAPCALNSLERLGVPFHRIDRIFLTHFHPDHTLGLGHLMAALNQLPQAMVGGIELYGPEGLTDFMRYWHKLYPSTRPKFNYMNVTEVKEGPIDTGSPYLVSSLSVRHSGGRALAYRMEFGDRSLVYTGDTEVMVKLVDFARGCDLLISECSFSDGSSAAGHMTPSDVAKIASGASVGAVLLVHMYPDVLKTDIESVVRREYKGRLYVGYDSFQVTI